MVYCDLTILIGHSYCLVKENNKRGALVKLKTINLISGSNHSHLLYGICVCLFAGFLSGPGQAQDLSESSSESVAAEKLLSQEDVEALNEALEEMQSKIETAEDLERRLDGSSGLDGELLKLRIVRIWSDALEQTIAIAKDVAAKRESGYEVLPYIDALAVYFQSLPDKLKIYSRRPGEQGEFSDGSLSPLEQAIADDRFFATATAYDDSSWAMYRGIEAAGPLDLSTVDQEVYLKKRVAELLANALIFLDMSLRDVSNLRAASKALPEDPEVKARLLIAESRVSGTVAVMENNLLLQDGLGVPTTFYRQQLVTATGTVSAGVFDAELISGLVSGWMTDITETLKLKGPNFLFQAALFLIIVFLSFKLASLVKRLIGRGLDGAKLETSQLARRMITSASSNLIIAIGVLLGLSQLGVSLGPVLAGLGVAGFIIGFALQDSLANFASGMLILLYRPYDVGDIVEISGVFGRVHQMSLVNTTILTLDNQTLIVPNNKIWQDVIKNLTHQDKRRIDLVFGITYDQDIDVVEDLLHQVLKENDRVLMDPEPLIRVHELADSSVNLIVRPWVKTDDYWDVYWELMKAVKQRFDAEGISIPFPQRDVHLYAGEPATHVAVSEMNQSVAGKKVHSKSAGNDEVADQENG
jgi:small conductance mechanosensitive channel